MMMKMVDLIKDLEKAEKRDKTRRSLNVARKIKDINKSRIQFVEQHKFIIF